MPRPALRSVLLLLALVTPALAGDEPPWQEYDALLKRWVDEQGRVDYRAWKAEGEPALRAVVAKFARVDPDALTPQARKAYWIDVYNAVTLQGILEFFPLRSIKDKVSPSWSLWKDYEFGPRRLSLDHIEHELLRKLGDPRVHAALVCAAKSCPPLRREAYLPDKLDEQLDQNARAWLADPERGVRVEGDTVRLSRLFEWFAADFGPDPARRLAWVAKFLPEERRAALLRPGLKVAYLDYDWALNARP